MKTIRGMIEKKIKRLASERYKKEQPDKSRFSSQWAEGWNHKLELEQEFLREVLFEMDQWEEIDSDE